MHAPVKYELGRCSLSLFRGTPNMNESLICGLAFRVPSVLAFLGHYLSFPAKFRISLARSGP